MLTQAIGQSESGSYSVALIVEAAGRQAVFELATLRATAHVISCPRMRRCLSGLLCLPLSLSPPPLHRPNHSLLQTADSGFGFVCSGSEFCQLTLLLRLPCTSVLPPAEAQSSKRTSFVLSF